ncbi:hypothetical protein L7F22_017760 [Adiantum nelumboides]|nr:hypothetical protein [Adiantum nelumboides]
MGEPSSSWQNFNFRDDEGSAQGMQALRLLLAKLQEAQANPRLKPSVNNLLMTEDLMLTSTQRLPSSVAPMHLEGGEGVPVMHGPMQANVVPHPLQGPLQTDGAKKKQYHGQERHVGKIREEGDFHDDDDEPPSRSRHKKRTNERRTKRSRRNSSGGSSSSSQSGRSSHGRFPKKGRKSPTPPTSPSSSPRGESSSEESSSTYKGRHPRRKHHAWKRAKKLKKFKEGGKSITFQTFDGSYGHVDKVLTFIQQFDAAFGGEDFTEASKLRNVAMHLTKSTRHWWSTLCAKNQAPKTWKVCRLTIMKQFLDDDAEDNVLTAWRSLKFKEGESLQNYIEKFWDTCLKATVYRNINFLEKRQQFCAGLPEDMRTYVQALRPKTIAAVIHYTRVAYKIFKPKNPPNKGDKGKDKENGSSNVKSNNKKQASKRPYQGTNRLSPEEMERYRKENRCFRCGTTGHTYRECPQRNTKRETPKVSNVITPSFDDSQEANELCYAWGKIRDQHALILMDPGSTHNIISTELAEKLGIKVGKMGPALEAKGAFKGQEVAVTPLIGKLRVHVQSFVEAEEFYVAPLESHDVILGVPWFHRKHAKLIFPERLITLSHKGKDIVIRTHKKGDTIPLVNHIAFEKSMKSSLSSYMIFESHEPPYAGHRSAQPTIQAMELYFYWPTMRQDVSDYISKCLTCQKVKYDRHKAFGLLQPLPIPERPWESITMDFVFGLPKSSQGNNGIWTIVDRFSKQAHFIPVKKTIKATHMANLFMAHIFKYHGFPKSIISDRDPRMTSLFWQGLATNVGTKLNFSFAYHPQTDGQSEIVNSTILDLLKSYVNEVGQQTQWEKYLPLVEYAYNNTVHTSTGKTPFEIVEGIPKVPLILRTKEQIFAADEYVRDVREAFAKVKEPLQRAQVKQKEAADKHRRHLDLKEDDWVLLKFPKARLQHTTGKDRQGTPNGHQKFYAKLAKRFYGPFQILQKINPTAFWLKLPDHWHIHNAFHASLLKPYKGTPPAAPIEEDPPEFDEMEEILRPEKILKHEDKVLRTGKILRRYLVKFANYPDEDARWMQEPQLKESLALLQEYKAMYNLQDTQ